MSHPYLKKPEFERDLYRAVERIKALEEVLLALLNEDQGLHSDPERPVKYVRLSTDLREQIDDLLQPLKF